MSLSKTLQRLNSPGLIVTPAHERYLLTHSDVLVNQAIAAFVTHELTKPQRNRAASFTASSLGTCLRAQVLGHQGHPQTKPSTDLASIFIHGTWTHLKWQAMGLDAGWLKAVEVPLTYKNAKGTCDGMLNTKTITGWEFKSINSFGFKKIMERGPQDRHLMQVHLYMLATHATLWSIVYEDKDSQQWKEFVVPLSQEFVERVEHELSMGGRHVEEKVLPPMRPGCEIGDTAEFRSCPYRLTCPALTAWPRPRKGIKVT